MTSLQKNMDFDMIIDSKMTFDEAVRKSTAPLEIIREMSLLSLHYYSTDNLLHQGQIMVHASIAEDIREIFAVILKEKFPIRKAVPMSYYNWNDKESMEDNNSSSFCYRKISGTDKLSLHSFGRAIDINPFFNPLVYKDGKKCPEKATYDIKCLGTLFESSKIVRAFVEKGFVWGGRNREKYNDLHHFDKL